MRLISVFQRKHLFEYNMKFDLHLLFQKALGFQSAYIVTIAILSYYTFSSRLFSSLRGFGDLLCLCCMILECMITGVCGYDMWTTPFGMQMR